MRGSRIPTYSASGFIVVQVHEHAGQLLRVARVVFLLLPCVDEADGEPVAVVGVVAAAAPDPVVAEAGWAPPPTAAARRELAVAARPRHREHDPGRRDGVGERRLSARCSVYTRHQTAFTKDLIISFRVMWSTDKQPGDNMTTLMEVIFSPVCLSVDMITRKLIMKSLCGTVGRSPGSN